MENYMEENYMKGYLTRQEIINLIKEQLNYELNLAQIIEVQEKLGIIPKKIFNKSNRGGKLCLYTLSEGNEIYNYIKRTRDKNLEIYASSRPKLMKETKAERAYVTRLEKKLNIKPSAITVQFINLSGANKIACYKKEEYETLKKFIEEEMEKKKENKYIVKESSVSPKNEKETIVDSMDTDNTNEEDILFKIEKILRENEDFRKQIEEYKQILEMKNKQIEELSNNNILSKISKLFNK